VAVITVCSDRVSQTAIILSAHLLAEQRRDGNVWNGSSWNGRSVDVTVHGSGCAHRNDEVQWRRSTYGGRPHSEVDWSRSFRTARLDRIRMTLTEADAPCERSASLELASRGVWSRVVDEVVRLLRKAHRCTRQWRGPRGRTATICGTRRLCRVSPSYDASPR